MSRVPNHGIIVAGVDVQVMREEGTPETFPPAMVGNVEHWNSSEGSAELFELVVVADGTITLTSLQICSKETQGVPAADVSVSSVSAANDTLTATSHGLTTGQRVQIASSGDVPGGLAANTYYYVISEDANTVKLARTSADATADTAIDITDAGSGTITLEPDADTTVYVTHGTLNDGNDVSLTSQRAFRERLRHSPQATEYGIFCASKTGTANVTARIRPVKRVE